MSLLSPRCRLSGNAGWLGYEQNTRATGGRRDEEICSIQRLSPNLSHQNRSLGLLLGTGRSSMRPGWSHFIRFKDRQGQSAPLPSTATPQTGPVLCSPRMGPPLTEAPVCSGGMWQL